MVHHADTLPGAAACAGVLGIGVAAAGRVGGLALLRDARRIGAFFAGFFPAALVFPIVLAFRRVAAFATFVFLPFALVFRLAFFLVAIDRLPMMVSLTGSCAAVRMVALTGSRLAHSRTW